MQMELNNIVIKEYLQKIKVKIRINLILLKNKSILIDFNKISKTKDFL